MIKTEKNVMKTSVGKNIPITWLTNYLSLLFVISLQSQYKFVCEAIVRVYQGECPAFNIISRCVACSV